MKNGEAPQFEGLHYFRLRLSVFFYTTTRFSSSDFFKHVARFFNVVF
jgi:hypothetical protein